MSSGDRRQAIREWMLAAGVSAVSLVVYLTTMSRSVSFIDAGELAAAAAVLGIAHPTGYPLFTIVAHTSLMLNPGWEPVIALNGLSACIVAVSAGVFFRLLLVIARLADHGNNSESNPRTKRKSSPALPAAIASLVVAFSATVWAQSVAVEVYALHILLILLTVLTFIKSFDDEGKDGSGISRYLFVSAFLLGLSFSNHLTTLLLIPALGVLHGAYYGFHRLSFIRAVKLVPFFCIGLSPYIYLPLRSLGRPPVEWGYPVEMERFFWHVSGAQYRNWMFSSFESAGKQFSYFINNFSAEYNWLVIAFMALGLLKTYQASRKIFWFLTAAFVSCVLYSINYDIHDIDSYFLLAYLTAGIFLFFGLQGLMDSIVKSRWRVPVMIGLLSLPILQVVNNYMRVDESDNFLTEDYTHNVLNNTAPNALILTYQWDYFVSPSLYYQAVRKERTDVAIVDKELLRRSWYFIDLERRYPWLIESSRGSVDAFLVELRKFEHDLPYDPRVIETRYVEMVNDFIAKSIESRPVYVGPEIEPEFGRDYARIPSGLLLRLSLEPDSIYIDSVMIKYRPASISTRLTQGIRTIYARMLTATGALLLSKNRTSEAARCVEQALFIDPTYIPARSLRDRVGQPSAMEGR